MLRDADSKLMYLDQNHNSNIYQTDIETNVITEWKYVLSSSY